MTDADLAELKSRVERLEKSREATGEILRELTAVARSLVTQGSVFVSFARETRLLFQMLTKNRSEHATDGNSASAAMPAWSDSEAMAGL